jgi:transcriptional regulator with XRE-family HTH domain
MSVFSNIFKKIREQSGLTQQQMADKLGISRSAIGMYENGEREPNFETLELIADTFNVDMNYLLGKKPTTEVIPDSFHLNDYAKQFAQFISTNPDYKPLVDASLKVKKEDIPFVKEIIDRVSNTNTTPYDSIPDTPEEFERLYPTVDINEWKKKNKN